MHEKHAALETKGIASVQSTNQDQLVPYSVSQGEKGAILLTHSQCVNSHFGLVT
jgi:hypothetical protein